MSTANRKWLLLAPFGVVGSAALAVNYEPMPLNDRWQQLSYDADNGCQADVRGNGQIFEINAIRLGAQSRARFTLTNEYIKPIDFEVSANEFGQWQKYYLPFLAGRRGGTVRIAIVTERCSLELAFDWRRGIPVTGSGGEREMIDESNSLVEF